MLFADTLLTGACGKKNNKLLTHGFDTRKPSSQKTATRKYQGSMNSTKLWVECCCQETDSNTTDIQKFRGISPTRTSLSTVFEREQTFPTDRRFSSPKRYIPCWIHYSAFLLNPGVSIRIRDESRWAELKSRRAELNKIASKYVNETLPPMRTFQRTKTDNHLTRNSVRLIWIPREVG